MDKIPDVTPGEILLEEFLKPMNITAYKLSAYFGNSPDFWLGIQDEYDLRRERDKIEKELKKIPHFIAS